MASWITDVALAVLGMILTIYMFFDKKKSKKFSETKQEINSIWTFIRESRTMKEKLEKDLLSLSKEQEMDRQHVREQFVLINTMQTELKETFHKQTEDIKEMIGDLIRKFDIYNESMHELNLKLVAHIAENGVRNELKR